METNEFNDRQALDMLLTKLGERAPEIMLAVQEAINGGAFELVERKNGDAVGQNYGVRRLSDKEALMVALGVVRSFVVEVPKFVSSAEESIKLSNLGEPSSEGRDGPWNLMAVSRAVGDSLRIRIDDQTEERFIGEADTAWELSVDHDQVKTAEERMTKLYKLACIDQGAEWLR